MKFLVAALITALLVFALASAWSDMLQPQLATTVQKTPVRSSRVVSKTLRRKAPVLDENASDSAESPTRESYDVKEQKRDSQATAASLQDTSQLREQMAEVKQQELRLAARQENLSLLYDDIREELAAVEALRQRTADELASAERRVTQTAQPATISKRDRSEGLMNETTSTAGRGPYPGASTRDTAAMLRKLAERGNVEAAVVLLKAMKDRDAAKTLAALFNENPELARRLSDSLQASKEGSVRR